MNATTEKRDLVPRDGWESGPWDEEPDRVDWIDEATGYPCLVTRHFLFGYLCGYVGLPPGHRLHGVNWQDNEELREVDVWNGVTYSAPCQEGPPPDVADVVGPPELYICHVPEPGQEEHVWWFGFHCGGYLDYQPRMAAEMRRLLGRGPRDHFPEGHPLRPRYVPLAVVRAQCTQLAAQLAERAA